MPVMQWVGATYNCGAVRCGGRWHTAAPRHTPPPPGPARPRRPRPWPLAALSRPSIGNRLGSQPQPSRSHHKHQHRPPGLCISYQPSAGRPASLQPGAGRGRRALIPRRRGRGRGRGERKGRLKLRGLKQCVRAPRDEACDSASLPSRKVRTADFAGPPLFSLPPSPLPPLHPLAPSPP